MTTTWTTRNQYVDVGFLPEIFDEANPMTAAEQIQMNYAHGGGFIPIDGFELHNPSAGLAHMDYLGDPPMHELARAYLPLTKEILILFQSAWVAIVQKDGTYQVCRMD